SMALLGVKKRKAPEQPRHYIVDGAHDFPSWLSRQLQKIRKRARQSPSTLANDRFPSSATPHNAGSRQSRDDYEVAVRSSTDSVLARRVDTRAMRITVRLQA